MYKNTTKGANKNYPQLSLLKFVATLVPSVDLPKKKKVSFQFKQKMNSLFIIVNLINWTGKVETLSVWTQPTKYVKSVELLDFKAEANLRSYSSLKNVQNCESLLELVWFRSYQSQVKELVRGVRLEYRCSQSDSKMVVNSSLTS